MPGRLHFAAAVGYLAVSWRARSCRDFCSRQRTGPADRFVLGFFEAARIHTLKPATPNGYVQVAELNAWQGPRAALSEYGQAAAAACTGGRRVDQGRACSSCAARRSSVASSPKRPAICTPTGIPPELQCSGSEMAGWPVVLNSGVKGT